VPVILGDGMRLLSPELGLGSTEGIELTPVHVTATPDVTPHPSQGQRPPPARPRQTEDETSNPPPLDWRARRPRPKRGTDRDGV
jgi:hypothetical protein